MRVFNLFLFFIIALAIFVILLQNADSVIDVHVFSYTFLNLKVAIVLLISFVAGVFFGSLYMLYPFLKAKSSIYKLKKEYKSLYEELESLRTVSIDELPGDDLNLPAISTATDSPME